jgi:hypothetical protein
MKRVLLALIALGIASPVSAVPVVPNFTQGSMTSNTTTTSTVTETINSMDYNTGWQYVVTGTNVEASGNLVPTGAGSTANTNVTLDGVTSQWTGLNLDQRPNYTMTTPGAAFQFTESYQGPGLSNHTIIQRTTTINSVTDTTSTFTQ